MDFISQSSMGPRTIGLGLVLEQVAMTDCRAIYRMTYDNQPVVIKFWPWWRVQQEKRQVSVSAGLI